MIKDESRVTGSGSTIEGGATTGTSHISTHSRATGPQAAQGQRPTSLGGRKYFRRKKVCKFQVEKIDHISYRDVPLLRQFVSDRGKIIPRRLTGTSHTFQRRLTKAIKQARNIALLPFASRP